MLCFLFGGLSDGSLDGCEVFLRFWLAVVLYDPYFHGKSNFRLQSKEKLEVFIIFAPNL